MKEEIIVGREERDKVTYKLQIDEENDIILDCIEVERIKNFYPDSVLSGNSNEVEEIVNRSDNEN